MPKTLILSFLPWIFYFAINGNSLHSQILASVIACIAVIIFQRHELMRKFIFDWATLLFFLTLTLLLIIFKNSWLATYANTLSNIALALIAWLSLAIRLPFTLQYAREQVETVYWNSPLFIRINYIITLMWAITLTLMALQNVLQAYNIGNNMGWSDIFPTLLIIVTIVSTMKFPAWYQRKILGRGGVAQINGISPLKMAHLPTADIAYRMLGRGQPLLMAIWAHMTMHQWDPKFLQALARHFQVIIYDYPGTGKSINKTPEVSISSFTKITHEFITLLNLKHTIMLGYSMGGWIAQVLAANFPEDVSHLILIATDLGGEHTIPPSEEVLRLFQQPIQNPEEYGKALIKAMFPETILNAVGPKLKAVFMSASLEGYISAAQINNINQLTNTWHTQTETLNKITQPTLILTGDDDKITPTQNAFLLKAYIPQAELYQFANAGHGVIYQYPIEMADKIYEFVNSLSE